MEPGRHVVTVEAKEPVHPGLVAIGGDGVVRNVHPKAVATPLSSPIHGPILSTDLTVEQLRALGLVSPYVHSKCEKCGKLSPIRETDGKVTLECGHCDADEQIDPRDVVPSGLFDEPTPEARQALDDAVVAAARNALRADEPITVQEKPQ